MERMMENTEKRMDGERLAVIENIAAALRDGDTFRKVELHDPVVTDEDIKRVIVPFDNLKRKPLNKLKALIARLIAGKMTKKLNVHTEIVGLENACSVEGGAIITCNHFNPVDNTVVRVLAEKCGRAKKFDIIVQETNIFMKGFFGFLMRNCYTLPITSRSMSYMAKNFRAALNARLGRGDFVLIYPEQEMWFNYKKPRPLREGAYHMAYEAGVPIIPCFIEMRETDGIGPDGFYEVRHTLHVLEPIYPDTSKPKKDERERMLALDAKAKRECYESVYGYPPSDDFLPERDIAGYRK